MYKIIKITKNARQMKKNTMNYGYNLGLNRWCRNLKSLVDARITSVFCDLVDHQTDK